MKWIGKRISFTEDENKSTFVIYPEKKSWALGLIGAWCGMWLTIGIIMLWAMFTFEFTNQENIIAIVFMVFWVYYAQRVGRSFLWLLKGREMMKINEAAFSVKRAIGNYGKAHQYFLENIDKLQVDQPEENSFQTAWEKSPWVVGGERFSFEHKGKMIRFGRKLNEKDAKLLFNILAKRLDLRVKQARKNK
jgi:hypothetical protein